MRQTVTTGHTKFSYSHNFFCAVCRSNGGNRFGYTCEFRCTVHVGDPADKCYGNLYCLPDPYGCSCDVGVKGLDCYTSKLIHNLHYVHTCIASEIIMS